MKRGRRVVPFSDRLTEHSVTRPSESCVIITEHHNFVTPIVFSQELAYDLERETSPHSCHGVFK